VDGYTFIIGSLYIKNVYIAEQTTEDASTFNHRIVKNGKTKMLWNNVIYFSYPKARAVAKLRDKPVFALSGDETEEQQKQLR